MRQREFKETVKVGIFVFSLLAIVIVFTSILSKESSLFSSKMNIHALANNSGGLKNGAAVKLKGIKIGTVSAVVIEDMERVRISLNIVSEYASWIKKDSLASIITQGVLGDKFIEILGGSEDQSQVKEGDILEMEPSREMKDFIDKGENILVNANNVMRKIEFLLDDLNHGSNLRTLLSNASTFLSKKNVKRFTSLTENMDSISRDLAAISKRVNHGPGTLHSLVYDNSVYEDLQTLLGGAQRNKILKYFVRESIKKSEKIK